MNIVIDDLTVDLPARPPFLAVGPVVSVRPRCRVKRGNSDTGGRTRSDVEPAEWAAVDRSASGRTRPTDVGPGATSTAAFRVQRSFTPSKQVGKSSVRADVGALL